MAYRNKQPWSDYTAKPRRRDIAAHLAAGFALWQPVQSSGLVSDITESWQHLFPTEEYVAFSGIFAGGVALVIAVLGYKTSQYAYGFIDKSVPAMGWKRAAKIAFSTVFVIGMVCLGAFIKIQNID